MTLRPQACQFIIDELVMVKNITVAAKQKFGCRIIQRLLEHCREDQLQEIYEALLADGVELSKHPYGTYVMQHVAEYGTCEQVRRLLQLFQTHIGAMDYGGVSCGVILKAIE